MAKFQNVADSKRWNGTNLHAKHIDLILTWTFILHWKSKLEAFLFCRNNFTNWCVAVPKKKTLQEECMALFASQKAIKMLIAHDWIDDSDMESTCIYTPHSEYKAFFYRVWFFHYNKSRWKHRFVSMHDSLSAQKNLAKCVLHSFIVSITHTPTHTNIWYENLFQQRTNSFHICVKFIFIVCHDLVGFGKELRTNFVIHIIF